MSERVAVLGASDKPERYSNKAVRLLREHGHTVLPVHPKLETVEGLPVSADLATLRNAGEKVDTVSVYLRKEISSPLASELKALGPRRVIFNPGSENPALAGVLREAGIEVVENCTLVMLNLGQF